MLQFLVITRFLLFELFRIPFDIAFGIRRRIYRLSYAVDAPKDVTWEVVSARKIVLEGNPPIIMDTEPDPDRPGVYTGYCSYADRDLAFAYEILDERPGEGLVLKLINDECDPVYQMTEYIGAIEIAGDERTSTMMNICDVTHKTFTTRLSVPLGVVQTLQRLKHTAEVRAGTVARHSSPQQIKNALITGALTFASFYALFGPSIAAALLIVILLHEIGHVIAMRWAGIPVRGIYFVPFFGGVAVGGHGAKSEVARGLVALMGPGFSLLTTTLLLYLSSQNSEPMLSELALMSAILNGFNLLPILPLDGGHVVGALLSRASPGLTRAVQALMLLIGGGIALSLGDYLLLGLFLLIAPSALARPSTSGRLAPLSRSETAWLAVAYGATFVFYVVVTLGFFMPIPAPSA